MSKLSALQTVFRKKKHKADTIFQVVSCKDLFEILDFFSHRTLFSSLSYFIAKGTLLKLASINHKWGWKNQGKKRDSLVHVGDK